MGKINFLRTKHLILIMAPLLVLTLASMVGTVSAAEDHAVSFHATKVTSAMTLDGDTADWSDVAGISLTLDPSECIRGNHVT